MTKHQRKRIRKPAGTPTNKAADKQGKPKAAASSASTGGKGVTFENRAQAVKLLHMCLGAPSPGIAEGWTIVELRFQARVHGPQTDDLVCTVQSSAGARRKVLLQMKSGLTSRQSVKAFQDAIGGAWLDYQEASVFTRDEDQIVIVHDAGGKHHMSGAAAVAKAASMSLSAKEWLEKIETPGVSNPLKRNALAAFRGVVTLFAKRSIDDEELYQFIKHVSFLSHDLEEDETSEHIQLINLIGSSLLPTGYRADPSHVWSKLVTTCMTLNADSAGIGVETVAEVLGSDLARAFKLVREASSSRLGFAARPDTPNHQPPGIGVASASLPSLSPSTGSAGGQDVIPEARESSSNKIISGQLDHINSRIKDGKYKDAMSDLDKLGEDMKPFDAHQKARWYLMRGACRWHLDHDEDAASDFLKAADLCDDDDKLAAARVRGWLLKKDFAAAEKAGQEALERFPQSLSVWLIAKNAELLQGGTLTEHDIPAAHRGEADAFQLVAWCMHRAGNVSGAADVTRKALLLPTASFFTRDSALGYTLESVAENPLNVAFHMLKPAEREALNVVAQAFEPRLERLWAIQSESTLRTTVVNLGYVCVFLKRSCETLELLREARARRIDGPEFIRLELEAYRDVEQLGKALEVGRSTVTSMTADAVVTFAQIAATAGDLESIVQALEAASNLKADHEQSAVDAVKSLLWDALAEAGRQDEVLLQLDALDLTASTSVPLLVQANKVLRGAGKSEHANRCLEQVAGLVTATSPYPDRYLVAKALFHAQRFGECVTIYEGLLSSGVHSELHNDLLFCYLRLGAHAKAKKLLDSFPAGWMVNDDARQMAVQLAEEAGDWVLLKQLSLAQLARAPERAMSWIFRLMTANREATVELMSVLAELPEVVEGTTRELTQIAVCEMSNGFEERGLRRIYRMRRMNLTDVDVAAAHLSAHLMVHKPLPHLQLELPVIAAGTSFTAVDDEGHTFVRAIDPTTITDLPDAGEFRSGLAKEVVPFIGATVGAEIAVAQTFDEPKVFRVTAIGSSYRRLLDTSHDLLKESITQSSFMSVINLPEDEQGNLDFSRLKAQVLKSSEVGRQVMEAYLSAPLTIGGVCRLMRRSVVDAISGWPSREAKLDVGGGPAELRAAAFQLFARTEATYVIDAATLIELGRVECLHLLPSLPTLYCTTKTYDVIRGELEESRLVRASGTAVAHEGELAVVEITEQEWAQRIEFLERLVEAIDAHCEVRPSYGPDDWQRVPTKLREVVSDEEAATLALSLEHGATLFCLDARLRLLGASCGLEGVWPQVFLASGLVAGRISKRDYSVACMKFFLSGRNFTSLDATDLLLAVYQGDSWASVVVPAFQQHIAEDDVDFDSALNVVLAFLAGLAKSGSCQFGFLIEATGFLTEGLARHRHCPDKLAAYLKDELREVPGIRLQSEKALNYLWLAVDSAFARAKTNSMPGAFKGKVLFCSSPPWLLNGMTQHDTVELLKAAVLEDQSANGQISNAQATSGSAISEAP